LENVSDYCLSQGVLFTPLEVDRKPFANAPVMKQYPQEMYYRLLASLILPPELERVLYLDPDTLIINSIYPLWEMDIGNYAFAAASHNITADFVGGVNLLHLDTEHAYYNTGVMLIDLAKVRKFVTPEKIFDYVREHSAELLLPDENVFNFLYGKYTKQIDDAVWNYDARYFHAYWIKSRNVCDVDWVMPNTAILHFCGKEKPWHIDYSHRFGVLYRHYKKE